MLVPTAADIGSYSFKGTLVRQRGALHLGALVDRRRHQHTSGRLRPQRRRRFARTDQRRDDGRDPRLARRGARRRESRRPLRRRSLSPRRTARTSTYRNRTAGTTTEVHARDRSTIRRHLGVRRVPPAAHRRRRRQPDHAEVHVQLRGGLPEVQGRRRGAGARRRLGHRLVPGRHGLSDRARPLPAGERPAALRTDRRAGRRDAGAGRGRRRRARSRSGRTA